MSRYTRVNSPAIERPAIAALGLYLSSVWNKSEEGREESGVGIGVGSIDWGEYQG